MEEGSVGLDGARWGSMGLDGALWGSIELDGALWGSVPFAKTERVFWALSPRSNECKLV